MGRMAIQSNSIIRLEDVWKIYKMGDVEVAALQGMTLDIKRGEFVAIMGPSGSGKSTAVNMVGCLDVPTRGKVYLDGIDIARLSESDLAQIRGKKIGFIFQQFNLIGTLSALENVALPMMFQGVAEEVRLKRAKKHLELVNLADRMDHRPNELSGGQQQRVSPQAIWTQRQGQLSWISLKSLIKMRRRPSSWSRTMRMWQSRLRALCILRMARS